MAGVQIQAPMVTGSPGQSSQAEGDTLISRLDELLEQYLHTLNEYQKAREQLSKQLSSGYLSLAQANFQNRSTTHYGRDSYDERMQAIRIVDVTEEELGSEHPKVRFSISLPHQEDEKPKANVEEVKKPQATSESKLPESEVQPQESKENPSTKDKASTKVKDPIRWFGILVPPALRTAQQTFTSAFEGPIPQLAAISRDLRNQEIEIGRVRKQIKKL